MVLKVNNAFLYLNNLSFDHVLLHLLVDCAREGFDVWCLTPKPLQDIPADINLPLAETLKLIQFMYCKDCKEVIKQAISAHLWHVSPSIIVVGPIEQYFSCSNSDLHCFLFASLIDAANACSRKNKKSSILIIISGKLNDSNEVSQGLQHLIQLYVTNVFSESDDVKETVQSILGYILKNIS